jgi:hypothetical protein
MKEINFFKRIRLKKYFNSLVRENFLNEEINIKKGNE